MKSIRKSAHSATGKEKRTAQGLSLVTAEKTGFVVYKERVKALVKGEGHE